MKKTSLVILASVALMSVGACAVGKGKGKAPPPAASPVITKGDIRSSSLLPGGFGPLLPRRLKAPQREAGAVKAASARHQAVRCPSPQAMRCRPGRPPWARLAAASLRFWNWLLSALFPFAAVGSCSASLVFELDAVALSPPAPQWSSHPTSASAPRTVRPELRGSAFNRTGATWRRCEPLLHRRGCYDSRP